MPDHLLLVPEDPLRRAASGPSHGERLHIGRFIGVLYMAGAAPGALSLLLPHDGANAGALAAIVVAAFCTGAPLAALYRRVPLWMSHAVTALAAPMIGLAVYFSGDPGSVYVLMLVWPVLLTAYYFPRHQMAAHLAWMLVSYGAALVALADPLHQFSPITRWLLTAIALTVHRARQRRAWDDELDRELARAGRRGSTIAVAMLDIDRFKRFNDEHGHLASPALTGRADAALYAAKRTGRDRVVLAPIPGEAAAVSG